MRRLFPVCLVSAGLMMTACGGETLENDPRGQEACEYLVQSVEYEGDPEVAMGSLISAGQAASKARTESIRAAVNDPIEGLEEFPIADADALQEACEDLGVEVPD